MAKKKKRDWIIGVLKNSINNIRLSTLMIMLIDFIGYLLIFFILGVFNVLIADEISNIGLPDNIALLSEQQIFELSSSIGDYYLYFLFISLSTIIAIILLWSITRAILWKLSRKEKITFKYIMKSSLLGLIWFGLGTIPAIIIFLTLREGISMYVLSAYGIIFAYYSVIMFLNYSRDEKISIINPIKIGSSRLDFAIAFIAFAVIYYLLSQALNMVSMYAIGLVLSIIILLFYLAFSRYLFVELSNKKRV